MSEIEVNIQQPIELELEVLSPIKIGGVETDGNIFNPENYYTIGEVNYLLAFKLDADANINGGTF